MAPGEDGTTASSSCSATSIGQPAWRVGSAEPAAGLATGHPTAVPIRQALFVHRPPPSRTAPWSLSRVASDQAIRCNYAEPLRCRIVRTRLPTDQPPSRRREPWGSPGSSFSGSGSVMGRAKGGGRLPATASMITFARPVQSHCDTTATSSPPRSSAAAQRHNGNVNRTSGCSTAAMRHNGNATTRHGEQSHFCCATSGIAPAPRAEILYVLE